MDIAQFGKVLKSRFKNQKCRRGGQGAQIYVYKNVAIKSLDETKGDVSPSDPRLATSSDVTPPLPCSATLSDVTASHPRPATTSNASPPPPCSTSLSDVTLSPSRSATPSDVRDPSPTQPSKRKASAESSIIPKKRKFFFENSLPQGTPPDSPAAESFVSRSEHSASPAAPNVASQQEPSERAAYGSGVCEPTQFLANVSNSNDHLLSDANSEKLSRSKHWLPALVEDSGGTVDLTLDHFSKKINLKRIAFEKDSIGNKNYNKSNLITAHKTDNIIPPVASENLSDSKTLTSIENNLPEIERVNNIINVNFNLLCTLSPQSQSPKYNLQPASQAASVAPKETNLWDEEQHVVSGRESPVEAQGISCRMAVGRKWVDAQLRDNPGARTFAWEVAAAYARDHPDEPLPDTSIAVLIRNKFPSRRKAFKQGPVTTYYFQGLELVNHKGLCEVPVVKKHNGPPSNMEDMATPSVNSFLSRAEASTLVNISEDGKPISVINPPAQTVFIRNGLPCVFLKVKPFIMRPSNPQLKIGHEEALDKQEDSISYGLGDNASPRPTRVQMKGKSPSSPDYPEASKRGYQCDMSVLEYIQSEITDKTDNERFPTPTTTDVHKTTGRINKKNDDNVQINTKLYQPEKRPKIKKMTDDYSARFLVHKSKVWDKDMRKFACLNNQNAKIIKNNKSRKFTEYYKDSLSKYKRDKISGSNENNDSKSRKNVTYQETEYRFGHMESIKRTILETALNLFSEEGASLPEGERARRLEAALYERNPAVQYKDGVPWPSTQSEDAEEFPCRASQILAEASALAQGDATQLLYHHQYCPGQGCSYNGDLCLSLRAAYTHISIFRHQCHVWHCFSGVLALHASSCSRVDCPVQFCLFAKHELSSRGLLSWPAVEAERQLLRREFDECERSGRHEARLHCHHRQRVQLPLPKPVDKTG
ncbi:uncharacterized protein LOC119588323 [Penaeus monodon]|uniref:uncharacterized protein LOC119588323 n=1 Tax=Penaeus monodon TaxID=6687 RepID=UPI0018A7DC84|nr:uncharacterized protein LOC119588323 [Penaeus monodon]